MTCQAIRHIDSFEIRISSPLPHCKNHEKISFFLLLTSWPPVARMARKGYSKSFLYGNTITKKMQNRLRGIKSAAAAAWK
jgi:hypothetical protein